MAAIKINSLDAIIEDIRLEIKAEQDGDKPMTLSRISERVNIDRKTLRKWLNGGIIHASKGTKYKCQWQDGKLSVISEPNGLYRMTLSGLLTDLINHRKDTIL